MTPNPMPKRISAMTGNVNVEQIATDTVLQYNPLTGQGTAVLNFRGVLIVDDQVANLAGDQRTQVVLSTESHASMQYGAGLKDPVTGADLSKVSAAGWMLYFKAMAAGAYDAQFDANEAAVAASVAAADNDALPQRVEG